MSYRVGEILLLETYSSSSDASWTAFKRLPVLAELVLIAAVFTVLIPVLHVHRVNDYMIFCIFVLSFDLLYGYMGRLSFGQMLYLGTGAYVSAIFSIHVNGNPMLSLMAGLAGGTVTAALIGLIVSRLSEAPFALSNLAFNQVGFFLVGSTFQNITNGENGLSAAVESWGYLDFANEYVAYGFILCCFLLVFAGMRFLTASPFGVMIRSIKENEVRVRFLGFNVFWYKWLTFVICGAVAALAGSLYTLYVGFISPVFIHPLHNVDVIFACLIGGAGNLYGAIIGGFMFMGMKDILSNHLAQWEWMLGLILLSIVFWFRRGVTGLLASFARTPARVSRSRQMEERLEP
jgi:branched-chain amino acid transport system permease protein